MTFSSATPPAKMQDGTRGPWAGETLSQYARNRLKRRERSRGQMFLFIDAILGKISRAFGSEVDNVQKGGNQIPIMLRI